MKINNKKIYTYLKCVCVGMCVRDFDWIKFIWRKFIQHVITKIKEAQQQKYSKLHHALYIFWNCGDLNMDFIVVTLDAYIQSVNDIQFPDAHSQLFNTSILTSNRLQNRKLRLRVSNMSRWTWTDWMYDKNFIASTSNGVAQRRTYKLDTKSFRTQMPHWDGDFTYFLFTRYFVQHLAIITNENWRTCRIFTYLFSKSHLFVDVALAVARSDKIQLLYHFFILFHYYVN